MIRLTPLVHLGLVLCMIAWQLQAHDVADTTDTLGASSLQDRHPYSLVKSLTLPVQGCCV